MTSSRRPALFVPGCWLGLAACLPTALACASPQGAGDATGSEATFHLHGTVVDGTTGKPIPRVLVASLDRRLATMTNSEGAFTLEVATDDDAARNTLATLAAGGQGGGSGGYRVFLELRKPGYLDPQIRVSMPLTEPETPAVFKLMPAGVVQGHLTSNAADPPRNVMTMLLMHSVNNGERMWTIVSAQSSDRQGGFRFANLRPGEYAVMTNEWRGDQPVPLARATVTEQYPPVFFGDATSLAGATKVHLHYGETVQTDLHLRLAKYFPVTVPVDGGTTGINVRVNPGDGPGGFQLGFNQADHAVEGSLPSGTYNLTIASFRPQQMYASVVLHVDGAPVRTAPVTPVAPASVTVRLHHEFSGKNVPQGATSARVYLQPLEQGTAFATGVTQPDQTDEVVIPNVAPGQYTVRVEPSYGYAAVVQAGGTDLKKEILTVGDGGLAAPIDVTLRDDTGEVDGTVKPAGDDNSATGSFVSLLPTDTSGEFRTATAGPDGKFSLTNVAPGSYRLFAGKAGPWQMAWRDPEVIHALDGKGADVTVTSNGTVQADAPVVDDSVLEMP